MFFRLCATSFVWSTMLLASPLPSSSSPLANERSILREELELFQDQDQLQQQDQQNQQKPIDKPTPSPGDVDRRVDELLSHMTVDDFLGQMTQVNIDSIMTENNTLDETKLRSFAKLKVGSYLNSPYAGGVKNGMYGWTAPEWRKVITRIQEISMGENGGHPIIYGLDSVRGANYVTNATIFGEQINSAATFNTDLVHQVGQITGKDTEAAGIPWIFAPTLDISQNPMWPRTFETFGEDPYLAAQMGYAIVSGMHTNPHTTACLKHFIGYSKTPTGHDRDGVSISDFDLLNYFAPSFLAGIKAGAKTIMENYVSINGVPVVSSHKILKDLVRDDMGFDGVIVTDWAEIKNLHDFHRVAKSYDEAVRMAIMNTALDMSMVPVDATFIQQAKRTLQDHPEVLARVKESARRILKVKVQLGLYENPVPGLQNVETVGQSKDLQVALDVARESVILLQNKDNVLPLDASSPSVFLTGPSADNVGYLCGGWSVHWQGVSGNKPFPHGVSIKKGFENVLGGKEKFTFFNGLNVDGNCRPEDLAKAKELASQAQFTVVAIGESTYAEKPGDINDLALPQGQIEYVRALASTGTKVIVVLVEGRPRLLNGLPNDVHAVVDALLPGEIGGQAIAEILFGQVNPSGRLPISYPKNSGNVLINYNHRVSTQCQFDTWTSKDCEMEWIFGAGLSYTSFDYSPVTLNTDVITSEQAIITASVTVRNTGSRAGKEVVLLFLTQPFRSISVPEVKQLKKFSKIELAAGESKTVSFNLGFEDWSVFEPQIGRGFKRLAEDGEYWIAIGAATNCDVYNNKRTLNPLCARFTLKNGVTSF